MNLHKTFFLDRDGIITQLIDGEAPTKPKDLKLIPQIIPIIKKIKQFGFKIIVISNQPDIALGNIDESTKIALEERFHKLLTISHLPIDAIYYCHHHPKAIIKKYKKICKCQKPKPGMLFKACKKFNLDLRRSYFLGDRASDIKAGKMAGVQTILYDKPKDQKAYLKKLHVKPDYHINNFDEILEIVAKKAFVLASGKGERMMPLTLNTPKPLLKIAQKPMMEYAINLLNFHDFKNIGVNLFYLGAKIQKYFSDGKRFGVNITYVNEKYLTGTGGGVKNIYKKLKPTKPFFVLSSDMMINFDLTQIYKFHLQHGGLATLCCYFRSKTKLVAGKSGLIVFDKKTKEIKKFIERPKTEKEIISQWVYSSVAVLDSKILNYIPNEMNESKIVDLPKDIFPKLLQQKEKLYAYPISKKYYQLGIDTPDRIKKAEEDLKSGKFKPVM